MTAETRRYECKYVLTEALAQRVREYLAPHVEQDPHAARHGGRYGIVSLYLDSPGLGLCRETLEGKRRRFKLRIRGYSDDEPTVFFEIKRREGQWIRKRRARAPRTAVGHVLNRTPLPEIEPSQRAAFDEFATLARHIDARAVVLVRYEREALQGIADPRIRVTFDRKLVSAPECGTRITHAGSTWHAVASRRVILELKYMERPPRWMTDCVRAFGLQRTSYSKYANSVQVETNLRNVLALR